MNLFCNYYLDDCIFDKLLLFRTGKVDRMKGALLDTLKLTLIGDNVKLTEASNTLVQMSNSYGIPLIMQAFASV